jgi:hypothetical protein
MTVKALNTRIFVYEKGEIKNGYKHGVWNGNSSHPKLHFKRSTKCKLITGTSTDDNIQYTYTEVRQKPTPKRVLMIFINT